MTTKPKRLTQQDFDLLELYPPNDEPVPDSMRQEIVITQQLHVLRDRFRERSDVIMSSGNFIYYEQGNPRAVIAPDWYVSFGVDPDAILSRESYLMWEVGKPPEFVLEIASRTTSRNDLTGKRETYASLGIAEYWRFDPTGREYYPEPLVGERLVAGGYEPVAIITGEDGVISGYSQALDLIICWADGEIRFRDLQTGEYILRYEEERAARESAEAEVQRLREQLRRLESR